MSKSVLLVDRSSNLLLLLADYLRSKGLEVYTAESIEKGWQLYVETKPDIIVSGIAIKFNDCGYKFLKQVRDRNQQQPFIFLSAQLNNSIDRKNAMKLGANACFDKPFEPDELYQEIESLYSRSTTCILPAISV